MQLSTYLLFNGSCEQAFKFYERVLGGKDLVLMTYAQAPPNSGCSAELANKIMHARMIVGGYSLMGSDCPPERFERPQGFSVSVSVDKPEEAERIFHELAANGQTTMPIQETFWAQRFGMLIDQYGISWMVNCEKPMPARQ